MSGPVGMIKAGGLEQQLQTLQQLLSYSGHKRYHINLCTSEIAAWALTRQWVQACPIAGGQPIDVSVPNYFLPLEDLLFFNSVVVLFKYA